MKKLVLVATLAAMGLSGCAGRDANPVPVIQEGDAAMSCTELKQEITISQKQLQRLFADKRKVEGKNTAAAVAGAVIFLPALFFLNLKGAAREEAMALQDRIVGLADRHNNKGCSPAIEVQTETAKAKPAVPAE